MGYKKSGETRNRILKAAAKLFTERGYYEIGIGDIAKEAGIGRASFYYYFDDKEKAARALFDSYVERIYAAADAVAPVRERDELTMADSESLLLNTFVKYILMFEYIALNEATHAVYYDLVDYAEYDTANIDRLRRTTFKDTQDLSALYGKRLSDPELVAFMVTVNAVAKSIFKAINNGTLGFSLREATDYFFCHAVLPDIRVPEAEYGSLLATAFELCAGITID